MITQRKSKTGWRGRLASIATALLLGMGLTGVPLTASHAATVPPAPTGVKAVKRDNSSATVSWNASAGATSYQVEYQSANTSWTWKTETDYKTKTATSFVSTN
ncbi:MAG: fibronectin type III domain-containing protein, partial [Micrococcales bacterium]|nr:fibronectin type III domain-containing protein [Micrococcales bacterium]